MMNNPDLLWKGFQLCIAIQLVIVGVLHLFSKKQTKVILGLICLVISSYFFKTIFWQLIDNNRLFTFLLSGALFCFYGQLLYTYILAVEKKLTSEILIYQFSLPIIVSVSYAIIRTFFYETYIDYLLSVNITLLVICTIWIGFYFYLGIQKFKNSLNLSLVHKAKRKYKFFYYAINILLLNQFVSALLIVISNTTESKILNVIDKYYMTYFSEHINIPLYTLLSIYLLLYALSQSKNFKSFFLNEQVFVNKEILDGKIFIDKRIQTYFHDHKVYTNANLKIKDAATMIGVSEKILAEYIQNEYGTNFKDYINSLRINEFKHLLKNPENSQFTLVALSQESGFKSKATFYRVFKKKEGITPNEYLKSL